ncbi:MAG TPA: hypothetical protein VFB74_02935 [Kribbellaceae bacterium]|nr:hypothetical protein [Kribbellaceae bacterium]
MDIPAASTPIVCDMTNAPDTAEERLAEYQHLFTRALIGRERTPGGIRFRFHAEPGIAPWVRDLAAREKACCAFFAFEVSTRGDEVVWDAAVSDDDDARATLAELYALPDTAVASLDELRQRLAPQGLDIESNPAGTIHRVRHTGNHTGVHVGDRAGDASSAGPELGPGLHSIPRYRFTVEA